MIPFRILRSAKLYDLFLICLDHLLSIPTSIFWWAAEKRAHIATERERIKSNLQFISFNQRSAVDQAVGRAWFAKIKASLGDLSND